MGYKHTFEIITKDIQDIEKLVGNFENYSEIPLIELDLALSKLRNVYELLQMFRDADRIPVTPPKAVSRSESKDSAEQVPSKPVESPLPEEIIRPPLSSPVNEVPHEEPVLSQPDPILDIREESPAENGQEKVPATTPPPARQEKKTLAEKYNRQESFINEKLGETALKQDISSRLKTAPITSISGSMGINDKFFFIRELFKGDADKFRATMDNLEHASAYNEAYNYLKDNFEWDMESFEVKQLLALVRRKFSNL